MKTGPPLSLIHICDPFYNPNLTLDREDFSESDALPKDDPVPGVPARG